MALSPGDPFAHAGGGILRRADGGAGRTRDQRAYQDDAVRDRRRNSIRPRPRAQRLRPRVRQPVLACAGFDTAGDGAFPHWLSRQGEPCAFLLGQLRPSSDAVLGSPLHPGVVPHLSDAVAREAYSHEVSSAGFWPGGGGPVEYATFYSYAY